MSNSEQQQAGSAEASTICVITETRNLKIRPFAPGDDQITTGKAWDDWLEEIEQELRYFKISNPIDKKDAPIIYGGKEIARLEKSLPNPAGELDEFDKLRTKLNDYFTPKKNKHHARYLFLKLRPNQGETIAAYASQLREKANDCEFEGNSDERILEHLIQTTHNRVLIQKAINKKWNLSQFLMEAAQMEDTSLQVRDMKLPGHEEVKFVNNEKRHKRRRTPYVGKPLGRQTQPCNYCGQTRTHISGENCPAYGKKCKKCQKYNHFAIVCRSSKSDTQKGDRRKSSHEREIDQQGSQKQKRSIKKTSEDATDTATSSDDKFFGQVVRHLKQVKRIQGNNQNKTVTIHINDVGAEPDSGAEVNLMDEHQFRALVNRCGKDQPTLQPSQTKLSTLQSKLVVKGEFKATVKNRTCGTVARFVVVKGRINSPPLISKNTLFKLGMLQIREDGSFAEKNNMRIADPAQGIKTVTMSKDYSPRIKKITDRYNQVFKGIGMIRDKKNDKNFYTKFSMKPEAVPVAQKSRPVPYYLQKPLKKWLEQCIKQDIFKEVPDGEPVTWCSPLVVQPKPRFSGTDKDQLEPHMIRASVDLTVPKQFMERHRIIQGPTVEDFIYKFHDCSVFSKLDMRQGYHQLLLDPESRMIATFSTLWGNMRAKRLIFGAKSSQDLFDEAMYRIFGDIQGCLSQRDDILIGGRNTEEHDKSIGNRFAESG
ncbi:uncharacterized protein LOC114530123 [Dendronephthya gigantea]|uniref:uncharacterized protein LOC114530123 n=1 Tax=Dendronephthya gigantea TaxID=151771 RepID=UPI00106CC451|nr:uncharacterized protein LOC114530123 [Dendronephthya gigantea]